MIHPTRRAALALLSAACALTVPGLAQAGEVYTGWLSSTAIDGHDAVAFFREGRPVEGKASITHRWKDATWRFASQENRAAFAADPERYAPQFGGHCSWAAAQGYTAKGDPRAWRIVDGRLYLNYDAGVHAEWEKDIAGNISKANVNWPRVKPR